MSRYIDVSEDAIKSIFKKLNHRNVYPKSSDEMILRNYLDEFPTADVVEVVRCKDCFYWQKDWSVDLYGSHYCPCMDTRTMGDDYCSYGERREDEQIH